MKIVAKYKNEIYEIVKSDRDYHFIASGETTKKVSKRTGKIFGSDEKVEFEEIIEKKMQEAFQIVDLSKEVDEIESIFTKDQEVIRNPSSIVVKTTSPEGKKRNLFAIDSIKDIEGKKLFRLSLSTVSPEKFKSLKDTDLAIGSYKDRFVQVKWVNAEQAIELLKKNKVM